LFDQTKQTQEPF